MSTVNVRRVAIRCRVKSSREAERARAQRVFQDELAPALEQAVAEAGIGPDEHVCIRRLRMSARMWMGMTDDALRRAWAEALAAEIRRAVAERAVATVVRYPSAVAGVLDALRSVACGDVTRQWAWRQLGLASGIPLGGRRADAIAALLLSRHEFIVAALRALGDEPAFWQLLKTLDDDQLIAIAERALAAAGVDVTIDRIDDTTTDTSPAIQSRARLIIERAHSAVLFDPHAATPRLAAVAALAALEADPSLIRGRTEAVHGALAAIVERVRTGRGTAPITKRHDASHGSRPHDSERGDDSSHPRQPARVFHAEDREPIDSSRDLGLPRQDAPPTGSDAVDAEQQPLPASPKTSAAAFDPARTHSAGNRRESGARDATLHDHTGGQQAPRDYRARARSDWAGLLFLINVLRDCELIDSILNDPALAHRSSQWVLHRLASALVPADALDPAVLAFAGLGPRQLPAEFPDDLPNAGEQAALLQHARACIAQTCACVGTATNEETLFQICGRTGEVVADPGWIDVRFPASTVAVDVRRAGLDLDPGYVAWLGVVVKFSYV